MRNTKMNYICMRFGGCVKIAKIWKKMEKKVVVMLVGKRTLVGLMTIKDY